MINCMKYHDLRDFLTLLEKQGELKRITLPVDPYLEMTEIADRTLRAGGPATCLVHRVASHWGWGRKTSRPCAKSVSCWPS